MDRSPLIVDLLAIMKVIVKKVESIALLTIIWVWPAPYHSKIPQCPLHGIKMCLISFECNAWKSNPLFWFPWGFPTWIQLQHPPFFACMLLFWCALLVTSEVGTNNEIDRPVGIAWLQSQDTWRPFWNCELLEWQPPFLSMARGYLWSTTSDSEGYHFGPTISQTGS